MNVLPSPPSPDSNDPFADLSKLRVNQDFAAAAGVKKVLTTVPVRKPPKDAFIRTHSSADYRLAVKLVEIENDESYLVTQNLWPELESESTCVAKELIAAITKQGTLFIWAIRLPGHDGRLDSWNTSAFEIAKEAEIHWVRVQSNRELGAYEHVEAPAKWGEPMWPEMPLGEILRIAFRGKVISTLDHPILKRLRGEE